MQEIHADKVLMIAIGNNDYISYNKLFDRYTGVFVSMCIVY